MIQYNENSNAIKKIIIEIDEEFIQEFAEANFDRRLREDEMEQLRYGGIWDTDSSFLIYDVIGSAIREITKE